MSTKMEFRELCDVADLVEIIAENAAVADNNQSAKEQLNQRLIELIDARVRAILAETAHA
jgi:hypothetical protein